MTTTTTTTTRPDLDAVRARYRSAQTSGAFGAVCAAAADVPALAAEVERLHTELDTTRADLAAVADLLPAPARPGDNPGAGVFGELVTDHTPGCRCDTGYHRVWLRDAMHWQPHHLDSPIPPEEVTAA